MLGENTIVLENGVMWHTAEIVRIFRKLADDNGYEVFLDRKKSTAFCGDLLFAYNQEKKVFQTLFWAGLGDELTGIPFQSERELRLGLVRVEKFLTQHGLAQDVKREILDIVQSVFVAHSVNFVKSPFASTLTKTFKDISFKLTIPEAVETADHMTFSFKFIPRLTEEKVDALLESCTITDRVGNVFASHMDYSSFLRGTGAHPASIRVANNRKIYLTDATIEFIFLCSNYKRIVVAYRVLLIS